MTDSRIGRWLLVVLAVVGLAVTASVVSAHGDDPTGDDASPYDGTAAEWATRMEAHVTDHVSPGSVEWMEAHTGVTVEKRAQDVVDGGYGHGSGMYGPGNGEYGQGRGC